MGFKQMLLGFLLEFSVHGYEILKKVYSDFYPAEPEINEGLLYSSLKKYETEGLIVRDFEVIEMGVPRKVIHLTDKGRQFFFDWLTSDDGPKDTVKFDFFYQYPFLEKCNYFKHLNNQQIIDLTERELRISQSRLERYQAAREGMIRRGVDQYRIAIIEYGIKCETVKVQWLEDLLSSAREKGGE